MWCFGRRPQKAIPRARREAPPTARATWDGCWLDIASRMSGATRPIPPPPQRRIGGVLASARDHHARRCAAMNAVEHWDARGNAQGRPRWLLRDDRGGCAGTTATVRTDDCDGAPARPQWCAGATAEVLGDARRGALGRPLWLRPLGLAPRQWSATLHHSTEPCAGGVCHE